MDDSHGRKKVVYLLGAGFSAPLGLPTMRDWMIKSRQMREELWAISRTKRDLTPNEEKRKRLISPDDFEDLLKAITAELDILSISKNYYQTDLLNMEDVLSLLTMRANLAEGRKAYAEHPELIEQKQRAKDAYEQYIWHVLKYYTPDIEPFKPDGAPENDRYLPSDWPYYLFGKAIAWNQYGLFVAALFNLQFDRGGNNPRISMKQIEFSPYADANTDYSVITLNYDRILEMPVEYLGNYYGHQNNPGIRFMSKRQEWSEQRAKGNPICIRLAKIHGDISPLSEYNPNEVKLAPPIYSKQLDEFRPAWEIASDVLREATDLRIVGYSLPPTDTHIKYLLSAVIDNSNLRSIDVIARDSSGWTEDQYRKFICFRDFRFVSGEVNDYLTTHMSMYDANAISKGNMALKVNRLEVAHEQFMKNGLEKKRTAANSVTSNRK